MNILNFSYKRIHTIKTLVLILILFSPTLFSQTDNLAKTSVNGKEFYIYEVAPKEGFYSLEKKFNITQAEIEEYNSETKAGLKVGQKLLIPVFPKTKATSDTNVSYFIHTVIKGENLTSIANMYKTDVKKIIDLNKGIAEDPVIGTAIKIPQIVSDNNEYIYHTIEPKETLYSISKKYNVTMEEIKDDNPGLTPSTFAIGRIVRIKPFTLSSRNQTVKVQTEYEDYEVKKKETLSGISKKFKISLSELIDANPGITQVKPKQIIKVPKTNHIEENNQANNIAQDYVRMQELMNENFEIVKESSVNVSLLLPLALNKSINENKKNRYIEFYEGFLLSVDSLREKGISIDINVYDTDTQPISSIINNSEFANSDIIIGPAQNNKLKEVSDFAKVKEINIINPFTFDVDEIEKNPYLFQLNIPNSYLYAETSMEFIRLFGNRQIIFLGDKSFKEDKVEFTSYLQNQLRLENIEYIDFDYSTTDEFSKIDTILNIQENVVFIPKSSGKEILSKLLPSLQILKKKINVNNFSLFGYPEYQTYANQFMDYFYELDTYFYTKIYTNPFSPETDRKSVV